MSSTGSSCFVRLVCLLQATGYAFRLHSSLVQPTPSQVGTAAPIVILPGFGNDAIDYLNPLNQGVNVSFAEALRRRGHNVYVVPISRRDWLNFASGLFTADFWRRQILPTSPSYKWYLDKCIQAIELAIKEEQDKVVIVGHSAGGWLARALLRDGVWSGKLADRTNELIAGCVTLGTPHIIPPAPGLDVTRGALTHVEQAYPGAHLLNQGIFYTSVAGSAVTGQVQARRRTPENFAYQSYMQVCGRGHVTGDGVVPLEAAHLEGAQHITLEGVYHSIGSVGKWYGAEEVVDRWRGEVVELRKEVVR